MATETTPKGKLIAIGGAEKRLETPTEDRLFAEKELEVLARVLSEMKGSKTRLEVITSASSIPESVAHDYLCSFQGLGCEYVGILNLRNKKDVLKKEYLQRLENADALMVSGGNQSRLTRSYLGTPFYNLMCKRYQEEADFVIAGTSAGAMMMSSAMIYDGTSKDALLRGKANITEGFSLLPQSIVDTHFVNRNRYGRLMVAVAEYPDHIGIGIAEDTGIIIKEGRYLECFGSGQVHLLDGTNLDLHHINPLDEASHVLHFRNMRSHLLTKGARFDIKERNFL